MTYGCETLHGYLITVGPSEQQSEPQDFGPENRVVQKQGEETISQDTCGINPRRLSSANSEYKP